MLPICLAEIDRSRPYFIGLLGQRYGWVPEELPDGLAEQLPWLAGLAGTSVTEMEILHGVLNDPDRRRRGVLLHARSGVGGDALGRRAGGCSATASDDEVAALGPDAATARCRAPSAARGAAATGRRIRLAVLAVPRSACDSASACSPT